MKLALYKAAEGTPLDKAIDIGSGLYGYSHNEIVFDRLENGRDENGKYLCFSSSPREGEVRFKYIDIYSGKWHVIDLDDQYEWEDEAMIYQDSMQYIGAKYDYYGIFMWYILFWVKKQRDDQWWCSEIGAKQLGWENYRVTPNKLARHYGAPRGEFSFKFIWRKVY